MGRLSPAPIIICLVLKVIVCLLPGWKPLQICLGWALSHGPFESYMNQGMSFSIQFDILDFDNEAMLSKKVCERTKKEKKGKYVHAYSRFMKDEFI